MRVSGQGGIRLKAGHGLTELDVRRLESCWINTYEEYCAYALTYPARQFPLNDGIRTIVGDDFYRAMTQAAMTPRSTGFFIPADKISEMSAAYCRDLAVRHVSSGPGDSDCVTCKLDFEDDIPGEFRLVDRMPPIRDQGQRGTCAAFASVALCEFAEGCENELSPQFLYWAGKERAGSVNADGLTLDTIQETLAEDGVCEERFWAYNGKCVFDENGMLNAGQGPAPDEAVKDAAGRVFRCRTLSPRLKRSVFQYRKIIASGCPVVIGVLVFKSWTANPLTAKTGRVPMPYSKMCEDGTWRLMEESLGGHAMCLVGYKDDPFVPGGGYFIVRNSWGEDWAAACEEGAGHALIPYGYIASFTHAAFALYPEDIVHDDDVLDDDDDDDVFDDDDDSDDDEACTDAGMAAVGEGGPLHIPVHLRRFARRLAEDTRAYGDGRGPLIRKGTWVLSLPEHGSPLVPYGPDGVSDSPEYRAVLARAWLPSNWSAAERSSYEAVESLKQKFNARINANFSAGEIKMKPYPSFTFSSNLFQLMGTPRIVSSSEFRDFSGELFEALLEDAMSSCRGDVGLISPEWREEMKKLVSARVYKVSGLSLFPPRVYVVEVFATRFGIDLEKGRWGFVAPNARLTEIVKTCAEAVLRKARKGDFVFYAVGSGAGPADAVEGVWDGSNYIVVSVPAADGRWIVRTPGYYTGQPSFRDFCDRLMPVSKNDLVAAVKSYVDERYRETGSFRSSCVTVNEIISRFQDPESSAFSGFPRFRSTAVIRALQEMQGENSALYAVSRGGDLGVFVSKKSDVPKKSGFRPCRRKSWLIGLLLYHFVHFVGLLFCSALLIVRVEVESQFVARYGCVVRVLLVALGMFLCSVIQKQFNRLTSSIEKN